MGKMLYAIGSLSTVAFVVFLIGYALHAMKGLEPSANWCLVMAICGAVMTVGNVLAVLSGNFIAGLFLFFTLPAAIHYYRMWQSRKQGWQ